MRFKFSFIIFLINLPFPPLIAQSYNARQIELAERLQSLAKNAPPELTYIQTSKDIYEKGEDLWFKVYLLDAQYLTPSKLSKTLYLQLLNENTLNPFWQEKYEIQNGFANGRVYLESNLPEGYYLLAAYTPNSFFNDTTEFFAVRRVKVKKDITSSDTPLSSTLPVAGKTNQIQFTTFPEGGNLVSGLQSKMAFKAVNTNGEPVDITGVLFEDNVPLLEFKSAHAGMGSFMFVPDAGKKYFIRLSEPATDSIFLLPEIYPEGMTMQLTGRDTESLTFKISQSQGLEPGDIYLRVQCRGVVYGMTTAKLSSEILIKIPLPLLPQGIAEITLFNDNLEPVAERLVYINQDQKLDISTELSKEIYTTRGKVTVKIKVTDEDGYPAIANLGVTAFDKLYENLQDSFNILTHCYLSSQLKGRIYNPTFYFNSKNKDRERALDLLMLTQGWRKYVWDEMNLKKYRQGKSQIIYDGIKGDVYYPDRIKKKMKEQTFVIVFSPNKDSAKVVIPADSAGRFEVSPDRLKEWENDYVYMKPFAGYESQLPKKTWDPLALPEFHFGIRLKDPFETINMIIEHGDIVLPLPCLLKDESDRPDLYSQASGVIKIKEVTIKGQKAKIVRGKYLGSLDSIVMAKADEDYVCGHGVLNCPRHDRNESGTTRPIQGFEYWVILDYNTPGERVKKVIYWRPKFSEDELMKINNLTRVKAYYGAREFYKPNYDKENGDSLIPDFRNTLLWEPSVITDEKGEATLSFFCSDINTDFVGRIEGVSNEGLLGVGGFKFTVRKLNIKP